MGEESTQLDLSNELDRLSAMQGEDDDGEGPRLQIGTTRLDPEEIDGHQLIGVAVESDDPDIRGSRWHQPLHDLHRSGVTFEIDGEPVEPDRLFEAIGGPDLPTGYVLDRTTGAVSTIDGRTDETLQLRVIDAPPQADHSTGSTVEHTTDTLQTASRPGFDDNARYGVYDPVGRPLDPTEIE